MYELNCYTSAKPSPSKTQARYSEAEMPIPKNVSTKVIPCRPSSGNATGKLAKEPITRIKIKRDLNKYAPVHGRGKG
jgi:hypothetical protein